MQMNLFDLDGDREPSVYRKVQLWLDQFIAAANAMVLEVVNIFCNLFIWAVGIMITLIGGEN